MPLSQSAAYSNPNGNIYNAASTSAYGAPGQAMNAASGYANAMAAGHSGQQIYSGEFEKMRVLCVFEGAQIGIDKKRDRKDTVALGRW